MTSMIRAVVIEFLNIAAGRGEGATAVLTGAGSVASPPIIGKVIAEDWI